MLKNEYQFSSFGPVVQREYSSGSNIKNIVNGYDMLGNQKYKRVVYENADYETQHQYDYQSKLLSVTDPFNFVTQYKYDKTRMNRVQMNGASTVNNADNTNTKYEYEADGKLKSITYPTLANGAIIKSEYTYDSIGRLLKVVNKKNAEILSHYQYTYDNNGNITTVTDGTGATSYAYDKLNRLTQVTRPSGQTINYTYDARGNRSTFTSSGLSQSYSDITSTYNVWDQLESTTKDGLTTEYVYEMQDLRLSKTTDASTTRYAYNNSGEVIAELNGTNQAIANYIWGPDRLLAKKEAATGKNYFYLYNGHGDVVQIIDPTGQVVNKYQYDEWGNILQEQEQIQNSFKYAGEILDEETGYYYLRARYYDPMDGRFISKDTHEGDITNPLSMNLYTYVHNNPLIYVDPTGHRVWLIHGTFSNADTWTSDFVKYVEGLFNESSRKLEWTGKNSKGARSDAAEDFVNTVYQWHSKNPDEPIRLVGHSHGGNVAILLANLLAKKGMKVETLITIATPVREYKLESEVGQHIQMYNNRDIVQMDMGGYDFGWNWWKLWNLGPGSTATRKFENAENVRAKDAEKKGTKVDAHSAMHSNVNIWKKYIEPILKLK